MSIILIDVLMFSSIFETDIYFNVKLGNSVLFYTCSSSSSILFSLRKGYTEKVICPKKSSNNISTEEQTSSKINLG